LIEKKVSQKKDTIVVDDNDDNDVITNSKIQKAINSQDRLRSVQYQDELKKKKVYRAMRLLESSFNPGASTRM
jgi:hypothetical protein